MTVWTNDKELFQMTAEQRWLVQASAEKTKAMARTASHLFFGYLFELDAGLEALLPIDSSQQTRTMMRMIELFVNALLDPEEMTETLQVIGSRVAACAIGDQDYRCILRSWLWTLERTLGDEFTQEMKEAWICTYEWLTSQLKSGARTAILVSATSPSRPTLQPTSFD